MSGSDDLPELSDFHRARFSAQTQTRQVSWARGRGGFLLQRGSTDELNVDVPATARHILMLWTEPHRGRHEVFFDNDREPVAASERPLFFLPAGHRSRWVHRDGYPSAFQLHFDCNALRELGIEPIDLQKPAVLDGPMLAGLAARAAAELACNDCHQALMLDALGMELLIGFARHSGRIPGPIFDKPECRGDWRIRRSLALLDELRSTDIGLSELAAEVGLTERHYASLFRAATGLPPHRWLLKRRIERACAMLSDPRLSITEIALELGFASSQHFATVFRRHTGATPSAYRRERLS